jgi:hypothetical protein
VDRPPSLETLSRRWKVVELEDEILETRSARDATEAGQAFGVGQAVWMEAASTYCLYKDCIPVPFNEGVGIVEAGRRIETEGRTCKTKSRVNSPSASLP